MEVSLSFSNNENIDIVCFSLSRCDAPISSPALSLAKELGKKHRVFFIEHPYTWKDYFREKLTRAVKTKSDAILRGANIYYRLPEFSEGLTAVTPQIVYSLNFLPQGLIYDHLSELNNSIVLKTLRKVLQENSISRYIFINFFDPYFLRTIPDDIRPEKYIYQCMDDMSQVPYTSRHGVKLEEQVIRNADCTICTSTLLTKMKSEFSPNVHFLPNAADTEIFGAEINTKPHDLPNDGRKIVGFTGSIEYRTDFQLLRKIALQHSDKWLFLIGPVYGEEHSDARLQSLENVVFAGPRKINELPAYLKYFDCAIIPYKKNELTASIYPLKINEYLAAGKPVVATDFSEDISSFREVAYIAKDHEAFIAAIDIAIMEDDEQKKQQRKIVAASNSWTRRVEEFWKIIS